MLSKLLGEGVRVKAGRGGGRGCRGRKGIVGIRRAGSWTNNIDGLGEEFSRKKIIC